MKQRNFIFKDCQLNYDSAAAWLAQLGRAPVCWAGGHGYEPRPDQHSGSLNNWEESATFVMTSANG